MSIEDLNEELSEELKKKLSECKSLDDVIALAKEEGRQLSDEELEHISGGAPYGPCSHYWDE